jgi:hypothetical protein
VTLPRPDPAELWDVVLGARAALEHERQVSLKSSEPSARVELVRALESYVASLTERGHPVPYALRDELRLQRLTCTAREGARPPTR